MPAPLNVRREMSEKDLDHRIEHSSLGKDGKLRKQTGSIPPVSSADQIVIQPIDAETVAPFEPPAPGRPGPQKPKGGRKKKEATVSGNSSP